ncbi:hypothetical protein COJ85_10280 [Bacillus sp. AFS076308]|uniref:hypothetical protein n=1 Tax=unclassified Bacillus (in: firmicutes) TaxID=185979 RepID=UPI000BF7832B|nr:MULTISPECIES: hypothetical protein [unclassified Bacillus (in: firmicutes)]PFO05099.1 hypothetical protein COJ85_10280 [Bacillus sp. AFS076308]PGV50489.1 hypothetical protein COD92_17440 [Bacillus sp. AFS037270]
MFGKWISWNKDMLRPNGIEMENVNKRGKLLAEKVKKELGTKNKGKFSSLSPLEYMLKGIKLHMSFCPIWYGWRK